VLFAVHAVPSRLCGAGHITALVREDLSSKAIEDAGIRRLIGQFSTVRTDAVSLGFFHGLCRRLRKTNSAAFSTFNPYAALSTAREASKKIASLKDRADCAAESAPNAQRTLLCRRLAAIRTHLEAIDAALSLHGRRAAPVSAPPALPAS